MTSLQLIPRLWKREGFWLTSFLFLIFCLHFFSLFYVWRFFIFPFKNKKADGISFHKNSCSWESVEIFSKIFEFRLEQRRMDYKFSTSFHLFHDIYSHWIRIIYCRFAIGMRTWRSYKTRTYFFHFKVTWWVHT